MQSDPNPAKLSADPERFGVAGEPSLVWRPRTGRYWLELDTGRRGTVTGVATAVIAGHDCVTQHRDGGGAKHRPGEPTGWGGLPVSPRCHTPNAGHHTLLQPVSGCHNRGERGWSAAGRCGAGFRGTRWGQEFDSLFATGKRSRVAEKEADVRGREALVGLATGDGTCCRFCSSRLIGGNT